MANVVIFKKRQRTVQYQNRVLQLKYSQTKEYVVIATNFFWMVLMRSCACKFNIDLSIYENKFIFQFDIITQYHASIWQFCLLLWRFDVYNQTKSQMWNAHAAAIAVAANHNDMHRFNRCITQYTPINKYIGSMYGTHTCCIPICCRARVRKMIYYMSELRFYVPLAILAHSLTHLLSAFVLFCVFFSDSVALT